MTRAVSRYSEGTERLLQASVVVLTALFLCSLPASVDFAQVCLVLLALLGLVLAIKEKRLLVEDRLEKVLFWLLGAFIAWSLISYFAAGEPKGGWNAIWNRQAYILFVIPLFFLYRRVETSNQWLFWLFLLSGPIYLGVAVYEWSPRVGGDMNPNGLGAVVSGLFIVLILFGYFSSLTRLKTAMFLLSGASLLSVLVWTQSRGAWLSLLVTVLVLLVFLMRNRRPGTRLIWFAAFLISIIFLYQVPKVQERVDLATSQLADYVRSTSIHDEVRMKSVGIRLEMWRSSLLIAFDSPIFGVGTRGYHQAAEKLVGDGKVPVSVLEWRHPHSIYFSSLAMRGVPGLILLLLILLLLTLIFVRSLELDKMESNRAMPPGLFGLMVLVNLAMIGVTEEWLESKPIIYFYTLILGMAFSKIKSHSASEPGDR